MNENQFLSIRTKVFDDIRKHSTNRKVMEARTDYLKQNQANDLKRYENFDDTSQNNSAYQYILEQYNLLIKQKEFESKYHEVAISCALAYFGCAIAIVKQDKELYDLKMQEYINLIQTEAINRYNLQISMIKQKRVTDSKIKKYINYLSPAAVEKFKNKNKNIMTQQQLSSESVIQMELEEEKLEAEKAFNNSDPVISETDFVSMKMYDTDPIELAKVIYPNFKDKILEAKESQVRKTNA